MTHKKELRYRITNMPVWAATAIECTGWMMLLVLTAWRWKYHPDDTFSVLALAGFAGLYLYAQHGSTYEDSSVVMHKMITEGCVSIDDMINSTAQLGFLTLKAQNILASSAGDKGARGLALAIRRDDVEYYLVLGRVDGFRYAVESFLDSKSMLDMEEASVTKH